MSQGLGIAPLLLDSPQLLYEFPQQAVAVDSAPLAFGRPLERSALFGTTFDPYGSAARKGEFEIVDSGDVEIGLGGLWRTRGVGAFALSQPSYLLRASSQYYYIPIDYNVRNVLQVGAGMRLGFLRTGAAFRATRSRQDSGEARGEVGSPPDQLYGAQNEIDYREVVLGLGAGSGRATADAALEWIDESYEEANGSISGGAASAVQLTGKSRGLGGFAARAAADVGASARLVAAGQYSWWTRTWSGQRVSPSATETLAFEERTEIWSAGLELAFATSILERMAIAGTFEHRDEPLSGLYSERLESFRRKLSEAALSLALDQPLWRSLRLRAGVAAVYTKNETEDRRSEDPGSPSPSEAQSRSLDEHFSDRWHWGVAYTWRRFRLEAALPAPPRVDAPIDVFDLYISF